MAITFENPPFWSLIRHLFFTHTVWERTGDCIVCGKHFKELNKRR